MSKYYVNSIIQESLPFLGSIVLFDGMFRGDLMVKSEAVLQTPRSVQWLYHAVGRDSPQPAGRLGSWWVHSCKRHPALSLERGQSDAHAPGSSTRRFGIGQMS